MTVFAAISKKISWKGTLLAIPTIAEAMMLSERVADDIEAFEQIFRYRRFCGSPLTVDQDKAYNILWEAYQIGRRKYTNELIKKEVVMK